MQNMAHRRCSWAHEAVPMQKRIDSHTTAHHVVKILAVGFLERADRKRYLVDPLLSTALEPKDPVTVICARTLASAPKFCLRGVDLPKQRKRIFHARDLWIGRPT